MGLYTRIAAVAALATLPLFAAVAPAAAQSGGGPAVVRGAPFGGNAWDPRRIVVGITPDEGVKLLAGAGITDAKLREGGPAGTALVGGHYKGADIIALLEECKGQEGCSILTMAALFGKQDSINARFVNAFNKHHFAHLIVAEDGAVELQIPLTFSKGVSIGYLQDMAGIFVQGIDQSTTYKVE